MHQTFKEFANAITSICNDGLITTQNHTFDNYFIEVDAKDVWRKMYENGDSAVGISFSCPYWKYTEKDVAFVFKDADAEIKWVHLTRLSWEHYVLQCFSSKDGPRIIDSMVKGK